MRKLESALRFGTSLLVQDVEHVDPLLNPVLGAVIVVDIAFLQYAYISFFCLLAGLATLHLVYIILTNKCARECPELFA